VQHTQEEEMKKRTLITGIGAAVLVAGLATGVAVATGGDDDGDETVSGPQADKATEAALGYTHDGKANSVERDSENGATWEVEVTGSDGKTVDVRLDENYKVVVIEGDNGDSNEGEGGGQ
jgi:hypothetical protein